MHRWRPVAISPFDGKHQKCRDNLNRHIVRPSNTHVASWSSHSNFLFSFLEPQPSDLLLTVNNLFVALGNYYYDLIPFNVSFSVPVGLAVIPALVTACSLISCVAEPL